MTESLALTCSCYLSHSLTLMHLVQSSVSLGTGGSWYGTLELGASSLSGLLAFECSEPLAWVPAWTGALMGPEDVRPTRGLDPPEVGSLLLEAGSNSGKLPPWAPAPRTQRSSAAQHMVPGQLRGD